jgi:hypothetical protein
MIKSHAADNEFSRLAYKIACLHCSFAIPVIGSQPLQQIGDKMEFTALFLATVVVMLFAWRGPRPLALGLFAALLVASVATYLHHATDTLKLSF